jgi:hypothetical protein
MDEPSTLELITLGLFATYCSVAKDSLMCDKFLMPWLAVVFLLWRIFLSDCPLLPLLSYSRLTRPRVFTDVGPFLLPSR